MYCTVQQPPQYSCFGGAGTTRLQLLHKGDKDYTYTDLANILPMGGILSIGIIAWLLDKKVIVLRYASVHAGCLALCGLPNEGREGIYQGEFASATGSVWNFYRMPRP